MTPKRDIEIKPFKVVTKPLKFTLDEVKDMIESYFNETDIKQWTVTGLALLFGSRQTLNNYQKLKGYSTMITQAKLMVENKYELMLDSRSSTGAIFALKNFGWVDKTEIESTNRHSIEAPQTLEDWYNENRKKK